MSIRPVDHGVLASQGGVIPDVVAYGGMVTQYVDSVSGNTFRCHTFRGKGGWLEVISNPLSRTADILIVAGGGNAKGDYYNSASGGGGAGGVRLITGETMSTGVKTMSIGRGGVRYSASYAGNGGTDSYYTGWTAPYPSADGGGAGSTGEGGAGGSGSGASLGGTGGSGNVSGVSPAEGNDGGDGYNNSSSSPHRGTGGGGGGAGAAGADGSSSSGGVGGAGGWSIGWQSQHHAGTSSNGVQYGGGGGGCERDGSTHGAGGSGGGGAGGLAGSTTGFGFSGVPNTGGGAGGSTDQFIGSSGGLTTDPQFTGGGSGMIIVRYQVQEVV